MADDLRDLIAKALRDKQKSNDSRPSVRAADAVMTVVGPEVERLRARVAELEGDSTFLDALSAAGVDNWDGYSHAHDIFREWQGGGETDGR